MSNFIENGDQTYFRNEKEESDETPLNIILGPSARQNTEFDRDLDEKRETECGISRTLSVDTLDVRGGGGNRVQSATPNVRQKLGKRFSIYDDLREGQTTAHSNNRKGNYILKNNLMGNLKQRKASKQEGHNEDDPDIIIINKGLKKKNKERKTQPRISQP